MHINVMFYASNCNTKLTLKNFPGVSLHCTPFRPAPLRFVQGRYVRPSPAGSPEPTEKPNSFFFKRQKSDRKISFV